MEFSPQYSWGALAFYYNNGGGGVSRSHVEISEQYFKCVLLSQLLSLQ